MTSFILNVTFDCSDPAALARFWSEVTGWPCTKEEMPDNPFWVVTESEEQTPRLVFVEVAEKKDTKNRLHLDIASNDSSQGDEIARLEALGASILDDRRQAAPGGWVVMVDPEGNEFCVEGGE